MKISIVDLTIQFNYSIDSLAFTTLNKYFI